MSSRPDRSALADRLVASGFSQPVARSRADILEGCLDDLGGPVDDLRALWVPGRIEILGKHTDYAGGRSLLCATDLGGVFAVRPRSDRIVTILDRRSGEMDRFELDPDTESETGDWTNYPRTAARRLARNFDTNRGADIVFQSNLPLAAGMSSSSALIVAFASILIDVNDVRTDSRFQSNIETPEDEAGYLGTVENGQTFGTLEGAAGVGTFGGSEDHTAILCSSPAEVKQYAFCPVRHEDTVTWPESHVFVVASSGIVAEKTGAALERFNRVSRLAAEAAGVIGRAHGKDYTHLADILMSGGGTARDVLVAFEGEGFAAQELVDRFDHFSIESGEIIPAAVRALQEGDLGGFGEEVTRSQETGARLLGNQVEQTVWLADRACEIGALTASAFGAGFGGSVYAIVDRESAESFTETWRSAYLQRYPELTERAAFIRTEPGPPVTRIQVS